MSRYITEQESKNALKEFYKRNFLNYMGFKIIESNVISGWFMTTCETVVGETLSEVMFDIQDTERAKEYLNNKGKKITIYTTSNFMGNVVKYEGKLVDFGSEKYAQYNDSKYVTFIPKRKRKELKLRKSYNPYLVIVEGWNHIEPLDTMESVSENVKRSKYKSFDERHRTDFNEVLNKYLNDKNILMDVRN